MNTDFSSGPSDYSSAEFKRNLNGYHLAHEDYFFEHESNESNEICRRPTDQREVIFFIRTIGLFHPHGKSVSICEYLCAKNIRDIRAIRVQRKNPCSSIRVTKTFVLFERFVFKEKIRVHPCAKNIRDIRAIRVQRKNPCLSVSIRVPKTFVIRAITSLWSVGLRQISCSKKSVFICAICGRIK